MSGSAVPTDIRLATHADAMGITLLYQQVYQGNYSNPLMRDSSILSRYLRDPANVWVVGVAEGRIIGSVVYETDDAHRLSRVFGGAVLPEFRGASVLERAMVLGFDHLTETTGRIDVVYATTRTSTPAPQIVTERLGYKKLGIFPNVHRTDVYETHCLTALFSDGAFVNRFDGFGLHPSIERLYRIVQSECNLGPLLPATADDLALDTFDKTVELEVIAAEKFALHRFEALKAEGHLQSHFYPFHAPNMVITSPCQTVEVFAYMAGADKYCTIIGIKKPREYNFTWLLDRCSRLLQEIGARYIEVLVRADKAKTIERVLQARFIPCAYFPAFQLKDDVRYDFVVCSRTFEILDFRNLKLTGTNMVFLEEYLRNLQDYYLKPKLFGPQQ